NEIFSFRTTFPIEAPETILALKSIMLDTVILNYLSMCTDGYLKIIKSARLDTFHSKHSEPTENCRL
ncbi:hypothetical protein ACUNF8_09555, partial [Serratia sp. IR-2025]